MKCAVSLLLLTVVSSRKNYLIPNFEAIQLNEDNKLLFAKLPEEDRRKQLVEAVLKNDLKNFCEIYTQGPVCVGDGARTISKRLNLPGCVADFRFNQEIIVDGSGNGNLLVGNVESGPGPAGIDIASVFAPLSYYTIKHIPQYETKEMTFAFDIFIQDYMYSSKQCSILTKGEKEVYGPGIFIDQKTGRITAKITFTNGNDTSIIEVNTIGRVSTTKWTNVVFSMNSKGLFLYMNGVLDGFTPLNNTVIFNPVRSPIMIGSGPSSTSICELTFRMSGLRIYDRALFLYEVQASSPNSLGIVEPSFLHIGCINCTGPEAAKKCVQGFHLCDQNELFGGVWQAAHIMGWTELNLELISAEMKEDGATNGLGLCCRDYY